MNSFNRPLPPKRKENWAPLFRWIPFTSYTLRLDIIAVSRRVSVSAISLMSRRICWISALVVISRVRTMSMSLMTSVILAMPNRGFPKKRFVSLTTLARTGIPSLRSLLTVVLTKSINWSTDFVSLQRSGPSAVASMLGSHAVKHSAVIWKRARNSNSVPNHKYWKFWIQRKHLPSLLQMAIQTQIRRHEKDCKFVSLYRNVVATEDYNVMVNSEELPYFSIGNAHLRYNAHPKLFRNSFWCTDNAHDVLFDR